VKGDRARLTSLAAKLEVDAPLLRRLPEMAAVVLGDRMTTSQTLQALIIRLTAKGVAPARIPGIVRAVLQIIVEGGLFTVQLVNSQLQQQGWGLEPLDETSFQLVTNILETEWGYRVRHYNLG
jgi:hypothetical protein